MSKQEALRFLQQAESDAEFAEKVRAALTGEAEAEASFSSVAADLGFAFTEEELLEASAEHRSEKLAELDAVAMDDQELEQVAGGGDRYECKDTYRQGENCFNNDECDRIYHFYKHISFCKYTYNPRENCINLDCSLGGVET